jgi:hypothetical protein
VVTQEGEGFKLDPRSDPLDGRQRQVPFATFKSSHASAVIAEQVGKGLLR